MPDLRQIGRFIVRPALMVGDGVGRALGDLRRQAPGARMVGEFAVKMGLTELGKRISPKKTDPE
ncbi:MAG: hypothetical protein RLZZ526_350 [Actinomycetota bacterium]|jgi:hypothetical protein